MFKGAPTEISIHSTARVETITLHQFRIQSGNFNPLHREGGDRKTFPYFALYANFNPLHREGGDNPELL